MSARSYVRSQSMPCKPAAFAIISGRAPARAAAVAALARGDWPVEVRTAAGSTPSSVSAWRR
eukprot:CAMPEP_0172591034 /NCGR_PEP_ID=MMETSP1068-20121228/9725_1 /TAXON_ID=35684 /ORGANISM="Pseudopedinella elastica, Strain CCMP716" /LENGTH=61 /DNA_ID=CAMNT_0013387249 /DNA_START=39 /DNA_END=221 /DNA_ORIENTATION=-